MEKVKELIEKRKEIENQFNELFEGKESFTDEENERFNELNGKLDTLNSKIEIAKKYEDTNFAPLKTNSDEEIEDKEISKFSDEIRGYVGGSIQKFTVLRPSSAGATIPKTIATTWLDSLVTKSNFLNFVNLEKRGSGNQRNRPVKPLATIGSDLTGQTEASDNTVTLPTLSLTPTYITSGIYPIGDDTIEDSTVDIVKMISETGIDSLSLKLDSDMVTELKATAVWGVSGSTGLTSDEILDLEASLKVQNPVFVMNKKTLNKIRNTDEKNKVLNIYRENGTWFVDFIPVVLNEYMDDPTSGKKPIMIYSRDHFAVDIVNDFKIKQYTETYKKQNAVGIETVVRADMASLANSIKYLSIA
ncbi:MAG: phage major capsid protein [bacterium]